MLEEVELSKKLYDEYYIRGYKRAGQKLRVCMQRIKALSWQVRHECLEHYHENDPNAYPRKGTHGKIGVRAMKEQNQLKKAVEASEKRKKKQNELSKSKSAEED